MHVERRFQPLDGGDVEMIGGLVEQQDIGLGREHAGERGAPPLAARKARRVFVAGEAQRFEQIAGAVGSSPSVRPASTKASVVAKPERSGTCGR